MAYSERWGGRAPNHDVTVVSIDDTKRRPRTVAIGSFDGVHLGHRDVIRQCDTVLTFVPHPLQILRPDITPALLTNDDYKIAKLSALGVREVVTIPFDAHWARQPADDFIDEVLVHTLDAREISVGFNFRFGANGTGTPERLQQDERFRTRVVPPFAVGSTVVSSTVIRALIDRGDVQGAAVLLGEPFAQPAKIQGRHTVEFAQDLAVPPAGMYVCDIDGVVVLLSCNGKPRLVNANDLPALKERDATVTFLARLDSDSEVQPP